MKDKIHVQTTWCADDVRCYFQKAVDHMTDDEIIIELENNHKSFNRMCVQSGRDVIASGFEIKEEKLLLTKKARK